MPDKDNVKTPLLPHQKRLLDKLKASGGVLANWGTGSGKTLGSIAALNQFGLPADVIAPAPLVENYHKELNKHLNTPLPDVRIRSYEKAVKDKIDPSRMLIFDEAHRGRNSGTEANKLLHQAQKAPARVILTATPQYNQVTDLAPLLNAAAGKTVLPENPSDFNKAFVREKVVSPSLIQRLMGAKGGTVQELKNKQQLINAAKGYVDVHRGQTENFPSKTEEEFDVPMSEKQDEIYRFHEGRLPRSLQLKIRYGLPLSKQESKDLNAFGTAYRQSANTPRPYLPEMTDEEEIANTPKIQKAVEELIKARNANPNHRALVYSNYLDAGLNPYARALQKHNIPHMLFTGDVPKKIRDQYVRDYNEGKVPVMLLSGAGSEGLDLKGTRGIQILDPAFNNAKIDQVIGRGARYMSHAHLPENERNVHIQRFYSQKPQTFFNRIGLTKSPITIDRYLKQQSDQKTKLMEQINAALQEASDRGPLK
jgi:SNF2 family DNA or RNA helicase